MNHVWSRLASASAALAMATCCGCKAHGGPESSEPPAAASAIASEDASRSPGDPTGRPLPVMPGIAVAPARCRAAAPIFSLDGDGALVAAPGETLDLPDAGLAGARSRSTPGGDDAMGEVEIGDIVAEDGGYAVSVIHRTSAGRTCAVVHVGPGARGPVRLVDLGPTLGDAPPPRLVRRGARLLAAAYGTHRSNRASSPTRELVAYAFADGGPASRAILAQQADDSLAFDLAASGSVSLVVWDEAEVGPRGVIRAATLSPEEPLAFGPSRDISPPDRDAEAPRLVFAAPKFVAFWLARRPEPADAAAEQNAAEALGEQRAYGWIESLDLDGLGAPIAAPRPVTPVNGHVSAYDVTVLGDGSVLVVARDDGEATEGSGGRLLRVRVAAGGVDPPLAFATDGLGRGAPALVDGRPPWLSWVGPREQLRLLPLDEIGAPAGLASTEDAMSDGRPIMAMGSPTDAARPVLVALPSQRGGQLRRFECAR